MRRRLMLGVVLVSLALAVVPSSEGAEHGAAGVDAAWVKAMKANDDHASADPAKP